MMSKSDEEAFIRFRDAANSDLIQKYENFRRYIDKYWKRKEEWVLAYRNVSMHDHNTNNFCEASVRLFKDLVLGRAKAYNIVALVDYTSVLLEEYYVARLRKFAHSRCESPKLLLNKMLTKASYLSESMITALGNHSFSVPSQKKDGTFYIVDTKMGSCNCYEGSFGGFCKHQAAVFFFFQEASPSAPGVTMAARYEIAILAFGESAHPKEFYGSLQPENASMEQEQDPPSLCDEEFKDLSTIIPMDSTSMVDEASPEKYRKVIEAIDRCHQEFGSSDSVFNKFLHRIGKVSTRNGWDSFLSSCGVFNSCSRRGKIKVQPTAISRRRAGTTRGSGRIPAGRPPMNSAPNKKNVKRKRNLSHNIDKNQGNAHSH